MKIKERQYVDASISRVIKKRRENLKDKGIKRAILPTKHPNLEFGKVYEGGASVQPAHWAFHWLICMVRAGRVLSDVTRGQLRPLLLLKLRAATQGAELSCSAPGEPSAMYDPEQRWSLSFAGCGFLGFYHVGATLCLSERAPHLLRDAHTFFGCSAGALHAVTFLCSLPLGASTATTQAPRAGRGCFTWGIGNTFRGARRNLSGELSSFPVPLDTQLETWGLSPAVGFPGAGGSRRALPGRLLSISFPASSGALVLPAGSSLNSRERRRFAGSSGP